MSVRRLAFMSAAAMLGFGLAGGPTLAWADSAPSQTSSASAPTVTQDSSGQWTVTLPGVGSVSFTVDSTTGAITGLTVMAADGSGFTAGSPTTTDEGVQVLFTSSTTSRVLQIEVEMGENGPRVTAEAEVDNAETTETEGANDATSPDETTENESSGDDSSTSGHDGTETTTPTDTTSSAGEGPDDGAQPAPAGSTTTTTTEVSGEDGGTSGTSGTSDGGSSSGSGSDG